MLGHGKFNRFGVNHVGHADFFKRTPYNSVDALPVGAYVAGGLDAADAGQGRAFSQPEGLFLKSVYNVGHTDFAGRSAKHVAATRAPAAVDQFLLAQQLEYFADGGLAQTQRAGQIRRTEYAFRTARHVG